ncbi:MAG: hypothetical protein IK005_03345, partial [Paludibacteraceae bacterium]|nr:hypothetical protein [Paludibacteraceae bacterium]
ASVPFLLESGCKGRAFPHSLQIFSHLFSIFFEPRLISRRIRRHVFRLRIRFRIRRLKPTAMDVSPLRGGASDGEATEWRKMRSRGC